MNHTRELELAIFKKAAMILSILLIVSLVLGLMDVSLGIVAGFFIGIFHFKLIVSSVKRLSGIEKLSLVRILSYFGCLFRFLLLALVFYLATMRGFEFFMATFLGFLTIKAAIILEGFRKDLSWQL